MSFLKISDPTKRDSIVKEYLDLKKNIRDNLLSERTGEQKLQSDLSKFFKPITETQKATTKEITEEIKPIKEGFENMPNIITFPAHPTIRASSEPVEGRDVQHIGEVAALFLGKYLTRDAADKTYGIYDKNNNFYIGNKRVFIKDNNIIVDYKGEKEEEFKSTPGLCELITSKDPDEKNIMPNDMMNYARLVVKTNTLHHNNDPTSNYHKGGGGAKWNNIHSHIWRNRKQYEGSGVIIISSDPNTLLERLDLLLASQEAGNTGVGNE